MLEYKLKWLELPVKYVDAKNTSKTCPHRPLGGLWGQADEVREVQPDNGQGRYSSFKPSDAGSRGSPQKVPSMS